MNRPAVMLVHSPVVGPLTWSAAAARLQEQGYRVAVPTLTSVAEQAPPLYRRFANAAAHSAADDDGPVVVVGHSLAGLLLPAITEELRGRATAAVFVDASLPKSGVSWFDAAPAYLARQLLGLAHDGVLPAWHEWFPAGALDELLPNPSVRQRFVAELPRIPIAFLEEPAPAAPHWDTVRCAYVRLSEPYDAEAADAERRGWWVRRMNADHLAMMSRPEAVADAVSAAITAITPPRIIRET